jgi:hypothetical protein
MSLNLLDSTVQKSIKLLEDDIDIKPIQKALILMVADGKKPATWQVITSDKWVQGATATPITDERWKFFMAMLDGLKLQVSIKTRQDDKTFVQPKNGDHLFVELGDLFIARDIDTSKELAGAVKNHDDAKLGELFGFPKSAVEAYLSNNLLPFSDIPSKTRLVNAKEMKFLNHMLSTDNWSEEVNYLPGFAKRVHEISPSIYRDCINR